jgi:hypothetical protein
MYPRYKMHLVEEDMVQLANFSYVYCMLRVRSQKKLACDSY